jgi:hypothetical protein
MQRDVASAPFHLADEGPMQTAGVRQVLLTLAQLMTTSPNTFTERPGRR